MPPARCSSVRLSESLRRRDRSSRDDGDCNWRAAAGSAVKDRWEREDCGCPTFGSGVPLVILKRRFPDLVSAGRCQIGARGGSLLGPVAENPDWQVAVGCCSVGLMPILAATPARDWRVSEEGASMKLLGWGLIVLVVLVAALLLIGAARWRMRTADIRSGLAVLEPTGGRVDFSELADLPRPTKIYLERALAAGQPRIRRSRIRHVGQFDMGDDTPRWRRFSSDQIVVPEPVGFDWNGRISVLPGVRAHVHDAYVGGHGLLVASVGGLIPVANLGGHDTPTAIRRSLDEGELLRFLAEAVWYPTALLPGGGLQWRAVDSRSAIARISDRGNTAELLFRFGDDGFVESVRSESRGRYVAGEMLPTPWEGRFWNVQELDGMRIPIEGEVAWVLPSGRRAYWRGSIEEIEYEFAQ